MRVLLDTNVLVRAVTRPHGPAGEVFRHVIGPRHTLVTAPPILVELHRVLTYPRVRERIRTTDEQIRTILEDVYRVAEVWEAPPALGELSTDPDDNPILQVAAAAAVNMLCTLDRHFRQPAVVEFSERSGFRIATDTELLDELRNDTP